ncbi:YgaP family membrane protein [Sediminispirochaeta smaragdinae]|jgi:hypothetical protein|uniref:Inner membrane protein YgaP-like transmembrane domain-containing protein n=1 Tax=Sediminispirochaeta smaragdinae (strain DSM 11293 / JCM 15392 / SEBR 4228) TaxID=573413 RepID=E1R997_SEDSS|nr:DUF2892 domain-containing protein [Sediminispirochaeta smaragdinae]ADK83066.1 conserved hypothetical protein [Sediminispirochaeta smaragdinae DSM 11293]
MKQNIGTIDRLIRIALAIIAAILLFTGQINGPLAVIIGVLGVIFLATGIFAFCPLYIPLGISTKGKKSK